MRASAPRGPASPAYSEFYNAGRPHSAHAGLVPDVVYFDTLPQARAGA